MNKENAKKMFFEALQNKLVQTGVGIIISLLIGFFSGRVSVDMPSKKVLCNDYIEDNKTLSGQIADTRKSCMKEKKELTVKVKGDMEALCNTRVKNAIRSADFSPKFHCKICVSRGLCK